VKRNCGISFIRLASFTKAEEEWTFGQNGEYIDLRFEQDREEE
jgi:hypothetical protein